MARFRSLKGQDNGLDTHVDLREVILITVRDNAVTMHYPDNLRIAFVFKNTDEINDLLRDWMEVRMRV